ncbi:NTP transferase domain-containing protein [Candidatus Parcubacteria bacterium]|nr:NTP transferase domain-containing protein [Candidatus Parcubacteria bacterium]
MIKKVVIAAAGQGTRMKHLSKNKSKHLICVKEKPFLCYLMENLVKAGYKEIILVVGFCADLMAGFLKEYDYKATIVNQYEILGPKEKEYGTLCPLKCVRDLVGNENFLAVYGDNLFSVRDLQAMNVDDNFNYIAARIEKDHPEKYGVLVNKGELLEKIIEKPKDFVGNFVNTGLYKFTPEVFETIPQIKLSPRGEYELTDALSLLAQKGKVKIKTIQDYWMDFGNPGDIRKMHDFLDGKCKND